jgi:osmotically-inducible protein OsmY
MKKDDNEIANEVIAAFNSNWKIPSEKVKVKVEKGWVTLEGEVNWHYQKEAAKDAVKYLLGVTGVSNTITIKTETQEKIEKKDIESGLRRNWSIDGKNIAVKVSGHEATLTGTVSSWYQKDEAGRIAWNAPGVWAVDNELVVDYV